MYQSVTIVGNVGMEPQSRFTPQGTQVTSFSVAVNKRKGDQNETIWFRTTTWDKLAEVCGQYVKKGMLVLCVGEIKTPEIFTKRDGSSGTSLEMTAYTVKFLSRVEDNESEHNAPAAQDDDDTSELPF